MLPRYLLLICLFVTMEARAVIVSGTNGTINTTGTNAGGGWDYVGAVNGASGIYLGAYNGGYWVLTARHVNAGNFVLSGSTYNYVAGTVVGITNPDSSPTDLVVFRIDAQPPTLPNLALRSAAVTGPAGVKMMGYGLNRAADKTTWYVETGTTPNVWSTTTTPGWDVQRDGYTTVNSYTKRWGDNTISSTTSISYSVSGTTMNVQTIVTDFSDVPGEAQGILGDSGGGVFDLNTNGTGNPGDDYWELAGSIVTVGTYPAQPSNTAVYNDLTYAANISQYRTAILNAVPEPRVSGLILLAGAIFATNRRTRSRTREPAAR